MSDQIGTLSAVATATLLGLAGLVHCAGMCGGIVGALTLGLHPDIRLRKRRLLPYLLTYNLGRLTSYTAAGALLGLLGGGAGSLFAAITFPVGHLLTAAFMLIAGLHLTGWWQGLRAVERGGGLIWQRYVQPVSRRVLPITHPGAAFLAGCLWGWLPCGLVYAALALAAVRGNALEGALIMLGFGVGTLPALLGTALLANSPFLAHRASLVRTLLGLAIMALAIVVLYRMSGVIHHH